MSTMVPSLMAIVSVLSAGANTYSAIKSGESLEEQQKQYRNQLEKANEEEKSQKKKQKELQDNYRNMRTNLYSEDINGIASNQLIQ